MGFKRFVAATTKEAMTQVRRALGDDAVILSNKRIANGSIEILAAASSAVEAIVEDAGRSPRGLPGAGARAAVQIAPGVRRIGAVVETFQEFLRRQSPATARGGASAASGRAAMYSAVAGAAAHDDDADPDWGASEDGGWANSRFDPSLMTGARTPAPITGSTRSTHAGRTVPAAPAFDTWLPNAARAATGAAAPVMPPQAPVAPAVNPLLPQPAVFRRRPLRETLPSSAPAGAAARASMASTAIPPAVRPPVDLAPPPAAVRASTSAPHFASTVAPNAAPIAAPRPMPVAATTAAAASASMIAPMAAPARPAVSAPATAPASAMPAVHAPVHPAAHPAAQVVPHAAVQSAAYSAAYSADHAAEHAAEHAVAQPAVPPAMHPSPAAAVAADAARDATPQPRTEIRLPAPAPESANAALMAEIASLRASLQQQLHTLSSTVVATDAMRRNPIQTRVMTRLLTSGFSVDVARRIALNAPELPGAEAADGWMQDVLAHNLRCGAAEDSIVERGGVFALVGPTGVGKTTTVAKFAARFAVRHGAGALGLITLDAYRVAAPEQLRTYGRILGAPVHLAQDAATLRELLASMKGRRLVLIDTCGLGPRDDRLGEMLNVLAQAGQGAQRVQPVLLLNAASHAETLDESARAWRSAEAVGAILTKLDEAARIGGALDCALRHKLRLLALTNGQRVPEDLHLPNARLLAHLALKPSSQLFTLADDEGLALAHLSPAAERAVHV